MKPKNWRATTKQDLIIEVWEALDCESVGANELEEMQNAVREKFGAGAVESPAATARVVADEGAVLRHAEVFELDLRWRREQMSATALTDHLDFSGLHEAARSIAELERLRCGAASPANGLRDLALKVKQDLLLVARSRVMDEQRRKEAAEIAEWLTVWLRQPELFADWLELRRRSPQFQQFLQK